MRSRKIILLTFLMLFVFAIGSVQVAQAQEDEFKFTVNNKSEEDVVVSLKLYRVYSDPILFSMPAGEVESAMVAVGEYRVRYTACGVDYDWFLNQDAGDDYTLVLYPCQSQPTKLQVKSHLSDEVELKIYGYEDYEVDIKPGLKTKVELYSGNIDYEYTACGGQVFFGEMKVAKNGTSQLVLHSCEWHLQPARNYAKPNPIKFKIINHASFPIIMTLIGPESYLVTVNPGVNIYTMISGNYRFSYYQDNRLLSGSLVVTPNGKGVLVVTPSYVLDYVDESADLE